MRGAGNFSVQYWFESTAEKEEHDAERAAWKEDKGWGWAQFRSGRIGRRKKPPPPLDDLPGAAIVPLPKSNIRVIDDELSDIEPTSKPVDEPPLPKEKAATEKKRSDDDLKGISYNHESRP